MGKYSLILVASLFLLLASFVIVLVNTGEASLYINFGRWIIIMPETLLTALPK